MKVRNMISDRGNTIANQFIIESGSTTVFQSYDSTIITVDYDRRIITVHPDYNYSKTTGKYRNMFFRDFGFDELSTIKGLEKALADGFWYDYTVKKAA